MNEPIFRKIVTPSLLSKAQLDHYLSEGYFPQGQSLCSETHITETELHSIDVRRVDCLRYAINQIQPHCSHQRILRKNKHFQVLIQPFKAVYWEYENLYWSYLEGIDFQPANSLYEILGINFDETSIFDVMELIVFHNDEPIGIALFYLGTNAAASITNFYDPLYKKYSISKFMMLEIIRFLKANNFCYYYPGYLVNGVEKFSYKLFLGTEAASVLCRKTNCWIPFSPDLLKIQLYNAEDKTIINFALKDSFNT